MSEPWAFVCHKEGRLGGVASASQPKKDLSKFLGGFAIDGYTITPVYNRDQYNSLVELMEWEGT